MPKVIGTAPYQVPTNADLGTMAFQDAAAISVDLLQVDNIRIDGNTITSINTDGNITIDPNGTGYITLDSAVTISGNLTVNGTTTTTNSAVVTIDDPVFTLGGDTAPASDDNKDRGIEFRWHNGSAAKLGFFGYDDSAGRFTFIPDAANTSEVFSGTLGGVAFGFGSFNANTSSTSTVTGTVVVTGGVGISENLWAGGYIQVDNLRLDANTLSSTNTDGNITLDPNGTGTVEVVGPLTVSGNTTLGDASTDTVQVNGYMGVGGAADSAQAVRVLSTSLVGDYQIGVQSAITGTSETTTRLAGFLANIKTAATVYTLTDFAQFFAAAGTKGAGSTITNAHGFYISDQTQGTNNYGITSLVSSGTNKWNIYASGTAANYFAGKVALNNNAALRGFNSVLGSSTALALQIEGSSVDSSWMSIVRSGATATQAGILLGKTRGAIGAEGVVVNSDGLGGVTFAGSDGTNMISSGAISAFVSGTPSTGFIPSALVFYNSSTTQNTVERLRLAPTEAVFNDPGNDYDFRVESDTNTHMLFVDAGNNRVGINTASPSYDLDVNGTIQIGGTIRRGGNVIFSSDGSLTKVGPGGSGTVSIHSSANMTATDQLAVFGASEIVFNEQGVDQNFRVESDTDTHALFVDAGNSRVGINNSSPTVALDITGDLKSSGNTTLGDASTDTVTVNGYMGVGGNGATNVGVYTRNSALTGATQVGIQSEIVGSSAATSNIRSFSSFPSTAAASFTNAELVGFYAGNAAKGAGSTITNLHGVYINDQTQGTNNYGITSAVSSGANKWNIYASGTASNYFAGNVGIGTNAPGEILDVRGNIRVGGADAGPNYIVFRGTTGDAPGSYNLGYIGERIHTDAEASELFIFKGNDPSTSGPDRIRLAGADIVFDTYSVATAGTFEEVATSANVTTKAIIKSDGKIGFGTSSPSVLVHVQQTTSTTNAVTDVLRLDSQSSGTPAAGIGVGMEFAVETAADNTEIGATIEAVTTDVTAGSEDFDLVFRTMIAGAAVAQVGKLNNSVLQIGATGVNSTLTTQGTADLILNTNAGTNSGNITIADGVNGAISIQTNGIGLVVVNDAGNASDFRVESDTDTHALFVDGSANFVGIGTSAPSNKLDVVSTTGDILELSSELTTTGAVDTGPGILLTGHDGTSSRNLAAIRAGKENGTSGNYAGYLSFLTRLNGGNLEEEARITSDGRFLLATTSSIAVGSSATAFQQIASTSASVHLSLTNYQNGTDGGILALGKSRGTTVGSYTVVANGDNLGEIRFAGSDGTDLQTVGAIIRASVSEAPGGNDMPTSLVFATTSDGSSSPSDRVIISHTGVMTVNAGTVINESGSDSDTRIEGDTDVNLVFVDASADMVGIGTNAPTAKLDVVSGSPSTINALQVKSNTKLISPDGTKYMNVRMLDTDTLAFSSSAGQLFSITNSLTGTIFAVNDISGIPSIEVFDSGKVQIAEFTGNVLIGTSSDNGNKLQVVGNAYVSGDSYLDGNIIFEGSSVDANQTTLSVANPTADRTITLPDANGTVAVSVSDTTTSTQGALNLDFTLSAAGNISATGTAQGLSTSGTPTFASLTVNGVTILNENGGDSDTRIEGDTDQNLVFVDASADFVGIGTNSPGSKLHVYRGSVPDAETTDILRLETNRSDFTSPAGSAILFKNQDGNNSTNEARIKVLTENDGTLGINDEGGSSFVFNMTQAGVAADRVIFRADGRVGIGTNTPSAVLNVEGSVIINDNGADVDVRIEGDNDANLFFTDGGNDRVGIGTNTPSTKLHIYGGDVLLDRGATTLSLERSLTIGGARNSAGGDYASIKFQNYDSTSGTADYIGAQISAQIASDSVDGGELFFRTSSATNDLTDRTKIDHLGTLTHYRAAVFNEDGGNHDFRVEGDTDENLVFVDASTDRVGIGTSSPAFKLHITSSGAGDATYTGGLLIENTGSTVGEAVVAFKNIDTTTNYWFVGLNQDTNLAFNYGATLQDASTKMGLGSDGNLIVGGADAVFTSGSGIEIQRSGTATLRLDSGTYATELRGYTDGTGIVQLSAGYLDLGTNATTRIRVHSNGNVGVNTTTDSGYKLEVNGSFAATTKSFVIGHPTKPGKKLRYGSLEGPENGVYVRGKLKGNVIELPEYWTKLVDPDSITVQLTPIGKHQKLYIEDIRDNKVYVANDAMFGGEVHCFYYVLAERIDVEKLEIEVD